MKTKKQMSWEVLENDYKEKEEIKEHPVFGKTNYITMTKIGETWHKVVDRDYDEETYQLLLKEQSKPKPRVRNLEVN